MNLSCSSRAIKYLMFIFNFLFVITGIALIAVGATIKSNYRQYETFLDEKYFSLPNLLIATGILIFIISFLGCYGAVKENWIILVAFSALLGIIFIFEFSAGIAGYVLRDQTSSYLEQTFYRSMNSYNSSIPLARMWDLIQSQFECCGVYNASDWVQPFNYTDLPISCCPRKFGAVGEFRCNNYKTTLAPSTTSTTSTTVKPNLAEVTSTDDVNITTNMPYNNILTDNAESTTPPFSQGCEQAFGDYVKTHAVNIGAVGFALAIIQIIGISFSCHLARQLKNQYYST